MTRHPLPQIVLLCGVALLLCACGYHGGTGGEDKGYQWKSLYRNDVQSVAVPIFTNRTYERGVEFALSKAVSNQLEAYTPYKVVNRDRADSILEGEIIAVTKNTISQDRNTAIPQEQLMTFTVNFTWKDLRNGRILAKRRSFEQTATYYPTLGEGRFVGDQEAVEKLAAAIVQELQAEW